jgi:hypothetical protein
MNAQRRMILDKGSYFVGNFYCNSITEDEYNELLTAYRALGKDEYNIRENTWIIYLTAKGFPQELLAKYASKVIERHQLNEDTIVKNIEDLEEKLKDAQADLRRTLELKSYTQSPIVPFK